MTRVPIFSRLALAFAIICIFSLGSLCASSTTGNEDSSAPPSHPTKTKQAKAKTSLKSATHGTSSGSVKAAQTGAVKPPPPPDPADEVRSYRMVPADKVEPVGEFNGDVRDLPQMPSREHPEIELLDPADYVHNNTPVKVPLALALPDLAASSAMPGLIYNYSGMSYADTYCTGGRCGNGHPPDTNGDVGLNHYIEGINEAYAIYDKATGTRLAAFTEASLWAGAGSTPCTTDPYGDPIVMYDQTADRWFLANLGFNLVSGNPVAPYMECIAVSKSGDPVAGGWWLYAFRIDQSPVPTNTLNDYPKFGNWNDGCLYMGANGYLNAGSFNGGIMAGFSKSDMYSGGPVNWTLAYLSGSANFGYEPAGMMGKGNSLPSPSTHGYFVTESNTSNAFNVRTITAGACKTGGSISAATAVAHATYNSVSSNIVPQPPPATSANTLDSLGNRLMQRVQYRNIAGAASIWVNHTTRVSGSNTSPQWGQIDVTGGTVHTPIVQQQIYRPDTSLFRWMGSLAVDNGGNMALCYSTSNATSPNYPSMQCAGRLATDALATLPQGETDYIAGAGSGVFTCGGTCHRWGDYSSMSVDPTDDCTFWHTNEYYNSQANGSAGNHQTQIIAFKYAGCTPVLPVVSIVKSHSGNFTQGQVGATYSLTVTNNGPGYTFGTVSVTDTLPAGLVATAIAGSGWTCTLGTLSCTRADNEPAGFVYPAITVTVKVASNAPASVVNSATVSGGGSANPNTSNDVTTINPQAIVAGTVQLTTTASLVKLKDGSYQATVTIVNNGTGTAQNVSLTAATLGVPSGTPLPQILGNIVPGGGFVTATVTFPSSAGVSGALVAEKYSGTYTGGTFGASIRATLP